MLSLLGSGSTAPIGVTVAVFIFASPLRWPEALRVTVWPAESREPVQTPVEASYEPLDADHAGDASRNGGLSTKWKVATESGPTFVTSIS